MTYSPGLDLVVVSYHSTIDLWNWCSSLDAVREEVPMSVTIVLVEAREDEVAEAEKMVDFLGCLGATVVAIPANCGYNRACNLGATLGTYDTIALFNADTRLMAGALKRCHEVLWSQDDLGIVGPRQVDEQGKITAAGIFGTLDHPKHRGWHEMSRGQYQDFRDDCVTVAGSAYFIRRQLWDDLTNCPLYREIDPDSEGAFLTCEHYYGESACSYHAVGHGWKCGYIGDVTIIHKWHASSPQGGWGEQMWSKDQAFFRMFCDYHHIAHD